MVRSVSPTPSFQSVEHLRQSNVDTKALLRHGSLSIGGSTYRVSLAADNSIAVRRDTWQKPASQKFFGAAKEMFTHRLNEGTTASRSDRIADALNNRHREQSLEAAARQRLGRQEHLSRPSQHSEQSRPESVRTRRSEPQAFSQRPSGMGNTTPPVTRSPVSTPPLRTLQDFENDEIERADYHGESPDMSSAKRAFKEYQNSMRPSASEAKQSRVSSHEHLGKSHSVDLPNRSLASFEQDEIQRAGHYSEEPDLQGARRAYDDYQAQRRAASAPPPTQRYSAPVRQEEQRQPSAREIQDEANYYGHSAGLSKWDTMLLQSEAEVAAHRRSEQRSMPGSTLQHAHSAPAQLESVGRLSTKELKSQAVDAAVKLSGHNLSFAVSILEKVDTLRNERVLSHANKRDALETFIDILSNKDLGTTMNKLQDLNRILDGAGRHHR
ncbi:hypothetical protein WH50_12835 [Pokkaliibacter plantistimulans]|uniref:Type III effector protein n=1 Tax=Pokkaliibacter plantistimulans TaxID=1635171 RepID=A0ABX5LZ33_9GAMM|nr:hypothetical protein [Pokkaliibacter plantistimulans]PXF30890.1 hypothetical protein WH50_12835 [Pokkaliibacter plantistimulans]